LKLPKPMKFKIRFVYAIVVLCTISNCKKPTSPPVNKSTNNADVYIVGTVEDIATIWKNGTPTTLSSDVNGSDAKAITVTGDDVYVAGEYYSISTNNGGYSTPVYWKNNVPVILPGDPTQVRGASANAIAVHGADVYVAGYCGMSDGNDIAACYWKNGARTDLSPTNGQAYATGIAIHGNDVYISGYISGNTLDMVPVYWKNGQLMQLPDNSKNATPEGIVIDDNNNVYLPGSNYAQITPNMQSNVPAYWKNGSLNILSNGNNDISIGYASSITLQGTDVFMAGNIALSSPPYNPIATYWKNGALTMLTKSSEFGSAYGISVNNADVYVVGEYSFGTVTPSGGQTYAAIWKNGVATQLSNTGSIAYGITIVQH
jgi:hypothetical protein